MIKFFWFTAILAALSIGWNVHQGLQLAKQHAQRWDGKECCECAYGTPTRKEFLEINRCRERGGVCCGRVQPCFGRD